MTVLHAQKVEVPPLAIAADLTAAMVRCAPSGVACATQTSVAHLLDMIELKREFNRRVLWYLGYRRKVVYYHA